MRATAWLWLALGPACNGEDEPVDPTVTGECASAPTWEGFASGYVRTWCLPCHSMDVPEAGRQGAPVDVNFDRWSEVYALRERVEARSTGEGYDMPPEGGVRDDSLALFEEWLACGALGEDEPAAPCEGELRTAPATVVASQADADELCASFEAAESLTVSGTASVACLCEVAGDVTVTGGELDLPQLGAIGGSLVASGSAVAIRAPNLESIGGSLRATAAPDLAELSVPVLETVGADLDVQGTSIVALPLDGLYSVGGALLVRGDLGLAELALPRLRSTGGDLVLESLPNLVALTGTRAVESIGGDLVLSELDRLPVLDTELDDLAFQLLVTVGGDVTISGNNDLLALHGFTSLSHVPGALTIEGNPKLLQTPGFDLLLTIGGDLRLRQNVGLRDQFGFVNLEEVGGALLLEDLPALRTLAGFEALATAGTLRIVRTGELALTVQDFPRLGALTGDLVVAENADLLAIDGLFALTAIGGDVLLDQNTTLGGIAGLSGVSTVGGAVSVTGNGALPQAAIDEWLGDVVVAGVVTVDGNGG